MGSSLFIVCAQVKRTPRKHAPDYGEKAWIRGTLYYLRIKPDV